MDLEEHNRRATYSGTYRTGRVSLAKGSLRLISFLAALRGGSGVDLESAAVQHRLRPSVISAPRRQGVQRGKFFCSRVWQH